MNKKRKIIAIFVLCIIGIISIIATINYINGKRVLYIMENHSYNTGTYTEFAIYMDGRLKVTKKWEEEKLIQTKISKEELIKLKQLANKLEDNYLENKTKYTAFDAPTICQSIYSETKSKWIQLKMTSATTYGCNNSDITEEILKLTDSIYKKYVK